MSILSNDPCWTPPELANYLQVKTQTVLRWSRKGIIPPGERFGVKTIRFIPSKYTPEGLAAWREKHPCAPAQGEHPAKARP